MRIGDPLLPVNPESEYDRQLNKKLYDLLRPLLQKVNGLAAEDYIALDRTATAAPTTGTYSQGDRFRNSNPTELGAATTKYVVLGWICVAGGTPGTWLAMRTLTGN